MSAATPVTVIIPVFNDEFGVDRCLKAIAQQTYPLEAIEVIVVDNGSIPPLSLSGTFPFYVHVIPCTTPGSYAARNAGAKEATGKIFAFIDADCWPATNWLEQGVRGLIEHGNKSAIGGKVTITKPERPTAVSLYQWIVGFEQKSNVYERGFSATANLLCTSTQFETTGPFDERLLSGGDREWCWRASQHGISVQYARTAIVYTNSRTDLMDAIRQARRVAAGRAMLRRLGLAHIGNAAIAKRRSIWQSTKWILSNKRLVFRDRLRVLGAAVVIRSTTAIESLRLLLGAKAERR